MKMTRTDDLAARWRIFPNALDLIFMAVWVFMSQLIVVRTLAACGVGFADLEAAADLDSEMRLSADLDVARTLMMIYVPAMVLSIAGILVYRRLRGCRGRAVRLSGAGFNPTMLLWGVIWILATEIVTEPLMALLPPAPDMVGRGFFALATTVAAAPLLEEFLCRGIVLESLRAKYGVVSAWLFSSVFFAVIHGQLTLMVNALIIGSIIGYICIRTRSVFSAVILHAINNALALMAISIGLGNVRLSSLIQNERLYWALYAGAAVICAAGLIGLAAGLAAERRAEKRTAAE